MDRSGPNLIGDERHDRGQQVFTRAFRQLLLRNGLTHTEFRQLSQWANPWGPSWMATSQISYMRRGVNLKAPGPRVIDALGQVNLQLARLAGDDGPDVAALPEVGPLPRDLRHKLEQPYYLRHGATGLPMTAGDIYSMWLGWIEPMPDGEEITDEEAAELSERLSMLLQRTIADRGLLLSVGMREVLAAYPSREPARQNRLRAVVAGLEAYTGQQLGDELEALGQMLGTLLEDGAPMARHAVLARLQSTERH